MKITSGLYEIFASGSVISFESEQITFELANNLKIKFLFMDTYKNNPSQRVEYNAVSSQELEIILINFNNSLGTGINAPIQVGTLNNRDLFLNFRVYTLDMNTNKTVHYSWYLGKESKNG